MNQHFEKSASLPFSGSRPVPQHAEGGVQRVDTVQREIMVLLPTGPTVFDVPCDCAILLRGEPIKLRVIQPGDQVRVTFTHCQVMKVARMLEVPPNCDPAAPACSATAFAASVYGSSSAANG